MSSRSLLVGVSALALFGTAQATSSVVSTLSNFEVTTTGTVSQYHPESYTYSNTQAYSYDTELDGSNNPVWVNYQSDSDTSEFGVVFAPVHSSASGNSGSAFASVSDEDMSMIAYATTGAGGGHAYAFANAYSYFSLGANSSITLTWDASIVGNGSGDTYFLGYGDYGQGNVTVTLGSMSSTTQAYGNGYWTYADDIAYSFEEVGTSKKLKIQTGSVARDIGFSASVFAQTVDYANPVPEPETWAMALAGLALAGVAARRRMSR